MEKQNTPQPPRRIPYGMMNFVTIREENCYYVDKTRFIEKVEDSNRFFFFNRPRRFGKSLTMSMLRHYYDINQADKFEQDIELTKAQICRHCHRRREHRQYGFTQSICVVSRCGNDGM